MAESGAGGVVTMVCGLCKRKKVASEKKPEYFYCRKCDKE